MGGAERLVDEEINLRTGDLTRADSKPVWLVLDAAGAKHEALFWEATADANAPEESNWKMWRPGPAPVHWLSLT